MEILALLTGILAAVVFAAERLAFAVMLWMLCAWVWRASRVPRALLMRGLMLIEREVLVLVGRLRWVREALSFWWMARSLRRQFSAGATP